MRLASQSDICRLYVPAVTTQPYPPSIYPPDDPRGTGSSKSRDPAAGDDRRTKSGSTLRVSVLCICERELLAVLSRERKEICSMLFADIITVDLSTATSHKDQVNLLQIGN